MSTGEPVVISVNSFTKILAPGLRLGWIEAAPPLIQKLSAIGYLISGGNVAPFHGGIVAHTLQARTADSALDRMCTAYKERAAALTSALRVEGLPPLIEPSGGYFVWVPLAVGAETVLKSARDTFAVNFLPGGRCDVSGGSECFARLCFALLPEEQLRDGAT